MGVVVFVTDFSIPKTIKIDFPSFSELYNILHPNDLNNKHKK